MDVKAAATTKASRSELYLPKDTSVIELRGIVDRIF